jgi:hypothetical protein
MPASDTDRMTTRVIYTHVQRGWLMPSALFGSAVFSGVLLFVVSREEYVPSFVWIIPALIFACGCVFSALHVRVDETSVVVSWGLGWPRARFRWSKIEAVEACEHAWWYGYGLRWTPRGWLWNMQGPHAARLKLRSGKCFHIGTDDPEGLLEALSVGLAAHSCA